MIVDATGPDAEPIRVLINTGGRHTELSTAQGPETAPARSAQVSTGRGVSGEAVMGRAAGASSLRVGSKTVSFDAIVVRDQGLDYDAQIGIGPLRGTVLLMQAQPGSNFYWFRPAD